MSEQPEDQGHRQPPKPPYISFKTLLNLWERLGEHGFPARIDKSYLESTAGGYATVVIASLRWLGLLEENGTPAPLMKDLVQASEADRKRLMAGLLRSCYPGLEERAEANETQAQFLEYFTQTWGVTGDTRRKAVAFYLGAAKWSEIAVGKLWKTPPSGTSAGSSRRNRNNTRDATTASSPPPPADDRTRLTVELRTGGTMTLTVSVDPLRLRGDDRDFFYSIVDKLADYEAGSGPGGESAPDG